MFERYTERARRTIFFARFEASRSGSKEISPEHLFLGLLREARTLLGGLPVEKIREEIEGGFPRREKLATSVDLPLNLAAKRILTQGAEQADALSHRQIDAGHLMLALLSHKRSRVAKVLQRHGLSYEKLRETVVATTSVEVDPLPAEPLPRADPRHPVVAALEGLMHSAAGSLIAHPADKLKLLPGTDWSRMQALGHLVEQATAYHYWSGVILRTAELRALEYPPADRAGGQAYEQLGWAILVSLWTNLQALLIHVLRTLPPEKWDTPCRIGLDAAIPFSQLMERYFQHSEDVLARILARR